MGVKGLTLSPCVILQINNENVQIYQAEVVILHVISHPILITKLLKQSCIAARGENSQSDLGS